MSTKIERAAKRTNKFIETQRKRVIPGSVPLNQVGKIKISQKSKPNKPRATGNKKTYKNKKTKHA